jgi:hypothetical protein
MVRRRLFRRIATIAAIMMLCLGLIAPSASAFPRFHTPNLVVLGDSFASGVGNVPYLDNACRRSNISYGPILERLHLVHLQAQAFVACSGATTEQVSGSGPNGEPHQIDSITSDTDVITVQALGNDFAVGAIEVACFLPEPAKQDCTRDTLIGGQEIGSIIDSIPTVGLDKLDALYDLIDIKRGPNPKSVVITPGYPNIIGNGGGLLCTGVSTAEVQFAATMVDNLNTAIKTMSDQHHYRYAPVDSLFRGHDACSLLPTIYAIAPPGPFPASEDELGGALHPNQFGQSFYTVAVAKRLFF